MDRFASIILTVLICVVALGQFVQVITRYVLEIPVMGLEESLLGCVANFLMPKEGVSL